MATTNIEKWANRLTYAAQQGGRVAWYAGHRALMRNIVNRMEARQPEERRFRIRKPSGPVPDTQTLIGDVAKLLARDLANAESGHYPLPEDLDGSLPNLISRSRAFFKDVPEVAKRRRAVFLGESKGKAEGDGSRPGYYRQNFHHQSGGWETEDSARLYDLQVEALFLGSARAMRRQALVPMAEYITGRDQRQLLYADIASGTGQFLRDVRYAFPRLPLISVDLSESYVDFARRESGSLHHVVPIVAKAEALPFRAGSVDMATCIYLFHELPPKIRRLVATEIGAAVKPGGFFVMVDSLQPGDEPRYDGLLEIFPQMFLEPYFNSYLKTDLVGLMENAGFALVRSDTAFFSKLLHFRRL